MTIHIPYEIGEMVKNGGVEHEIKGIYLYVTKTGEVNKIRLHVGNSRFVTIDEKCEVERGKK